MTQRTYDKEFKLNAVNKQFYQIILEIKTYFEAVIC